jgi:hypothetical protein
MRKKISIATIFIIIISAFFIAFDPLTLADPLINVTATPTDNTANVSTTYTIVFTTITPLTVATIPDRIVITFLTGFDASGAAVDSATGTQSGSDPTLASATATIVTLDVAADEAEGIQSIVLSGIINTKTAGAGKTVSVETQNGDNAFTTLDGPTNSAAFAISAAAVATLTVQTQPSAAVAGVWIAPSIEIVARDVFNNVVAGASVAVVLQIGTGTLSGTTPRITDASGVASFSDISIDVVGVDKVLRFSSNGIAVDSVAFTISAVDVNLPPIFGSITPSNGSINIPLGLNWSIPINDSEGNAFTWTIHCSNTQTNSGTGASNGTKSLVLSLAYLTTYIVWVNATDPTGSDLYTRRWYVFTTKQVNKPPNTPSNLYPSNGSTEISVTDYLSWTGGDPDNDTVTYDVYFGTTNPPPKVVSNQSAVSNNPGTMNYLTTYYWKIIAWDNYNANTTSPIWNFTTKSSSDGGGGGGGGTTPSEPQNKKPIAHMSAVGPYQGFVNSTILFDGSKSYDPDGNITKWFWVFGDETNTTGITVRHNYSKAGVYTVTLTVTDNEGATNMSKTICFIKQRNRPPTKPIITGPTSGTKNTLYTYTAFSTDPDNNILQYTIDWGESIPQSSGFLPNGTSFVVNHSWPAAGRFDVNVIVSDNYSESFSIITIYIDALQTRGVGYLLDNDGDGIYDAFYSEQSKQILTIQKNNNSYLIDNNGDGKWEYTYNATNGLMDYNETKLPGFEIIITIGAIALVMFWRRKRRDNE